LLVSPGTGLTITSKKARALLAYLALRPGQRHSRDHVAGLLWGDVDEAQARQSLRQTLLSLRRALPRSPFQGSDPSPTMVSLTDLTDAILFLAIAVLLGLLATNEIFPMWIRGLSLVGALLTLVRGILGFFPVFSSLDFIAPLSFVVMVVVLSGWAFRFSSDKPLAV
jgi:hypothetical protein